MKIILVACVMLISVACHAQALRDINYSYLYNPDAQVSFEMRPVRLADTWLVNFALRLNRENIQRNEFTIEWQGREALSSKEGKTLSVETSEGQGNSKQLIGSVTIPFADAPPILVAQVVHNTTKQAHLFYTFLEKNFPVNTFISQSSDPITQRYIPVGQSASIADSANTWIVSYYNDNFPAAAPAFSEAQARVSMVMSPDSVYTLRGSDAINFFQKGLYLLQTDTMATEGYTIRAENDYPRYSLIQNLPGPLIYICTKQEYDRLEQAKGDKKAFDRTVLSMTGDPDRAKKLIRNYFRRVELANQYFTSFKEGWKTDRGMIYIIFGLPDEVYLFGDREVWTYDNEAFDITFNFTKASTIFDPDNYVLIRERKYQNTWYEVIDLWRNARL